MCGYTFGSTLSCVMTVWNIDGAGMVNFGVRVVDFTFFPFGPLFAENKPQIERVEQISDAYHLKLGGDDVMVAYLIEVSRVAGASPSDNGA